MGAANNNTPDQMSSGAPFDIVIGIDPGEINAGISFLTADEEGHLNVQLAVQFDIDSARYPLHIVPSILFFGIVQELEGLNREGRKSPGNAQMQAFQRAAIVIEYQLPQAPRNVRIQTALEALIYAMKWFSPVAFEVFTVHPMTMRSWYNHPKGMVYDVRKERARRIVSGIVGAELPKADVADAIAAAIIAVRTKKVTMRPMRIPATAFDKWFQPLPSNQLVDLEARTSGAETSGKVADVGVVAAVEVEADQEADRVDARYNDPIYDDGLPGELADLPDIEITSVTRGIHAISFESPSVSEPPIEISSDEGAIPFADPDSDDGLEVYSGEEEYFEGDD